MEGLSTSERICTLVLRDIVLESSAFAHLIKALSKKNPGLKIDLVCSFIRHEGLFHRIDPTKSAPRDKTLNDEDLSNLNLPRLWSSVLRSLSGVLPEGCGQIPADDDANVELVES